MNPQGSGTSNDRALHDPDHPALPSSPTKLTGTAWKLSFKRALQEFGRDKCTDLAAGLTYYSVLSIFPAVLAVISLLGVFSDGPKTTQKVLDVVEEIGPEKAADTLKPIITQITESQGAGFALVLGVLAALWSASAYVGAFGRAMNRIYQVEEGRPIWKLRPQQVLITLVLVVLAISVIVSLVLSGGLAESVGGLIGLGDQAVTIWNIAKWPVILLIVILMVAVLYYSTPNVKQPKFRWLTVGSAIAIFAWIIGSALFGLYVANFGNYNKTYGSLAGVVVFLLWLWLTNLALLFGAEVDAEMERARQLQGGVKAERTLQLPPRDTRVSDKAEEKFDQQVTEGREFRQDSERLTREDGPDTRDG